MRPAKPMTTPATRERRASLRVRVRAAVFLADGAEKVCGWVRNLSTGGMYVETKARFPDETPVVLETLVWEDETPHCLRLAGWVARTDDEGMGIQFDPPDDRTGKLLTHLVQRFLIGPSP